MTATIDNKQLANLSGWDIAKALGVSYSGDSDPLRHGGFFYDDRDWEKYGYANVVEFWEDPETGKLVVQQGSILKPDYLEDALRSYGIEPGSVDATNVHAQIETVRGYAGIEPEGSEYPYLKVFDLDTWHDWRIWKSVRGWIETLAQ